MEPYFSLGSLKLLCSEMDEAFPGAVSFQQDGFLQGRALQVPWDVWEEDSASPFKAEAPAVPPGKQRARGTLWGTLISVPVVLLLGIFGVCRGGFWGSGLSPAQHLVQLLPLIPAPGRG